MCGSASANSGQAARKPAVALEIAVAGQRTDADTLAAGLIDTGQVIETVDVDQHGRPRQAEVHGRNQALAAGKKPGFVAIFGFERQARDPATKLQCI